MIALCDTRNPEIGVSPITGKWLFSTRTNLVRLCNSKLLCLPVFVQIDKIMSSIGAGIGSGLDIKEDTSGEIRTQERVT